MYDEEKINDSLEFVEQIKLYDSFDPTNISNLYNGFDSNADNTKMHYVSSSVMINPIEKQKESIWSDIVYIFVCAAVSMVIAFVFVNFIAHHTFVDGYSMNNSLQNGDCLVIEKISYYLHEPERFDIVVFPYSEDVNYIKRIIGMPGDTIQIIDGYVYINGKKLTDDVYGNSLINDSGIAASPITIGDDEYFVMGDNRNSSYDSRKADVGLIGKDRIDGKAVFRMYPFDSIGFVK